MGVVNFNEISFTFYKKLSTNLKIVGDKSRYTKF